MSSALELAIVTGLSGAGRSTAAKALEDLGWFVVDNLPPALLETMTELGHRSGGAVNRIAVVIDVRGRQFSAGEGADLPGADPGAALSEVGSGLARLRSRGVRPRLLFLEANDDALVRRFEGVRRPHPLQGDGRLVDGIERERAMLRDLRGEADLVIDTSDLNVHALRAAIDSAFGSPDVQGLHATVISFGYKYGLPVDADLVVDCRFLPNPHWIDELRPLTGRDRLVRDYVLDQPAAEQFLTGFTGVVATLATGYLQEGKRYLTLAVGCTGGKHRSVAVAEELAHRMLSIGVDARVVHRDLGRE